MERNDTPWSAPTIRVDDDCCLRIPSEGAAPALARLIDSNRERLRLWLPWVDDTRSVQDSVHFIQKCRQDWAVQGIYSGLLYCGEEIVGAMGLHSKRHRCSSLGYWVADRFTARGLSTRGCRALLDWAFHHDPTLHMVELRAAVDNKPSRRVAEKLKFKLEAELRDREWLYDHFVSHAVYSVTREEWSQL